MKGIELTEAIRLLFLVILSVLFLTSVYSSEVPKSETVIIPGELNDTLENAQFFNIQTEYTYGTNNAPQAQSAQGMQAMSAQSSEPTSSFRKTYVPKSGVMIVTLNNDAGSEYTIEVYNSCKQNLCNPRTLSPTQKHCLINVVPDYYYFKVTRVNGSGEHILDVDYLNGNNDSAPTAKTCSPPAIIDYSPARQTSIEMTYYILPKELFRVTAFDKENTSLTISWYENGVLKGTGKDYLFVPRTTGDYKIKAIVENEAYSNEIDWNVNVYDKPAECTIDTDCGEEEIIQNNYCSTNNSVYNKWIKYTCINPGTSGAHCEENTEERLVETCKNMCFNGSCNPQLGLNCPTEEINNNYSFNWNALDYNVSTTLDFSSDLNFKTKKSIIVTKLNSLPIKNYYQTIVSYQNTSKEKKVYARIVGKNKSGKVNYSPTCAFNALKESKSELICPTEPINDSYQFEYTINDSKNPKLQISYTNIFSGGKTFQITLNKTNPFPIAKYYATLLAYETKSLNKKLYAKISGKDAYGRDTSSNICEFELKPQIQPTLICPTQGIDSSYSFNWNAGDYTKTVNLELSYKNDFRTKTSIITTKQNPTPVLKYFKTLQSYAKKNTNGELYARILAKNKYNQTTTSDTCTFKLNTTTLSEENEKNNAAYFGVYQETPNPTIEQMTNGSKKIPNRSNSTTQSTNTQNTTQENNSIIPSNPEETILSQTTEINESGDTIIKKIVQIINEFGEIEEATQYGFIINDENPALTNKLNSLNILATQSTCTLDHKETTICDSNASPIAIYFHSSIINEIRYKVIDITNGNTIGRGQICSGELSPYYYFPPGHQIKFEKDNYICPNKQCKIETIDTCAGVTCAGYCKTDYVQFDNGRCIKGVCNYSSQLCGSGSTCNNNKCGSHSCTTGWLCEYSVSNGFPNYAGYRNSNCTWGSESYCANGCNKGSCISGCANGCSNYCSGSKLYYNGSCSGTECSYSSKTCPNGCSNGKCNSDTCTEGWKCYSSTKKGYQNEDCSWSNKTTCENGCEDGKCKSASCSTGWKCMDDETKAYQKSDCSWINDTYCENGCSGGSCLSGKVPGDSDYCTEEEQCEAGEGNCSKGSECQPGLYCVQDVGANYGYSSSTNVCEAKEGVGEWKCYNSNTAGFKFYSDSSWTDITNCPNGCQNGACVSSIIQGPDNDKDGYSNDDEILAGSDPNNFNSTPFTEFAKYSEEMKEITKMNEGQVFTDILLPFLAQKQSFENKTTQKINKIYFSSKDTNKVQLSIMNPVAGHVGFALGNGKGILLAGEDTLTGIISLIGLPAFIGESILSFGTYLINLNKVSDDLGNFYDFLAHSQVTYDSVTGTVDSTGKTLNVIWNSYFGEKFKEGMQISENVPFIVQDMDDKRHFAYAYASGYTGGYVVTTAASFGFGAGEVKAIIGGIKLGKLGTVAELYIKVARYPKLIWLLIKGDDTSLIVTNLVNKYTARLVNEVIEKKSTIKDIMEIADGPNGVVWLEKGNTKAGWIHIEEHIKNGNFRGVGIADDAVQETIFKSVRNPTKPIPSKTGNGFCYILEGVAKYPIVTVVGSNGYIITSHPEKNIETFSCK